MLIKNLTVIGLIFGDIFDICRAWIKEDSGLAIGHREYMCWVVQTLKGVELLLLILIYYYFKEVVLAQGSLEL